MGQPDTAAHCRAFRDLHASGCFVIPNPWDAGTARYLRHLGFPAVATTSAGVAFSLGLPDSEWAVSRDAMLQHIAGIVVAAGLPVNADFESGYADEPEQVAANVRLCLDTGVSGLSIEDRVAAPGNALYELPLATARIRAARAAISQSGSQALLTARAECYLVGAPAPLAGAIRRLQSYAEAGADVLYAPGPRTLEDIRTIVAELSPKPVNVLVSANLGFGVRELADLGVRRISVGSALARAAWGGFLRAATAIAAQGSFTGFEGAAPFDELNAFFRRDAAARR